MPRRKQYKTRSLYFSDKLEHAMQQLREYPLTIIEAPSGFGKTTALSHYFDKEEFLKIPVHWITFLGGKSK